MSSGKSERPGPERDRDDRLGQRGRELVERSRRRPNDRRSHLRDQRRRGGDIETLALVVDRCRRQAGFDQFDPPAVDDLVVRRRRHGDGPAEMIGDAQTHVDPIIIDPHHLTAADVLRCVASRRRVAEQLRAAAGWGKARTYAAGRSHMAIGERSHAIPTENFRGPAGSARRRCPMRSAARCLLQARAGPAGWCRRRSHRLGTWRRD